MKHFRIESINIIPNHTTMSIVFDDQDDVCDFMCQNDNHEKYFVFDVVHDDENNIDLFYVIRTNIDFQEFFQTKDSNV